MNTMDWLAILVLIAVGSTTVWALRRGPDFFDQFQTLWSMPWGRQVVIDFYGLEVVLALFMLTHAMANDTWLALTACLVLMPALGASAAAAYWIFAVA